MPKPSVTTTPRGFTLIELLVVIAIIGILSAVVLAALNVARTRGVDASIKSDLTDTRKQAELYYSSNNGSYAYVCLAGGSAGGVKNISDQVLAAAKATGLTTYARNNANGGAYNRAVCNDSAGNWAAQVPLDEKGVGNTQQFFCVDNKGHALVVATTSISNATDYDCQ